MEAATTRKTFKYKLQPTPAQATQLDATLRVCRELYNAALQERRDAWKMRQVSVNTIDQKAQLPEIRQLRADGAAVHSQVLQDVVLRIDRAFKAFFRRVKAGEKPGYPRFKGRNHSHSFTYPQVGQWRKPRWKYAVALQNRPYRGTLVPSPGRHTQDRHDLSRSRWVVCLLLLC